MATWSECVVQELEVGFLEERFGGSYGVGRVGYDDVVGPFVVGEEFEAVAYEYGDFWGGEEGGHVWEVSFGDADYGLRMVVSRCSGSRRDDKKKYTWLPSTAIM